MSGFRFKIDLFVPIDSKTGKISPDLQVKVDTIKASILDFKAYAEKLNPGSAKEEITDRAIYHVCYHDEETNKPCELPKDISLWSKDDTAPAIVKKNPI